MKKKLAQLAFILLIINQLNAQHSLPLYYLNIKKDIPIMAIGVIFGAGSWWAAQKMPPPLEFYEWTLLDAEKEIRWKFDRKAVKYWSPAFQKTSDYLLLGTIVAGATHILANNRGRENFSEIGVMALETGFLTLTITNLTKNLTHRTRPFAYNPDVPDYQKTTIDTRRSFFSGHTSMAAAASFFSAKVISDLFPDENWTRWVWAGAATLPALTGWARVRGGKHFPTDVLAGYFVGGLIGIAIPTLHRPKNDRKNSAAFSSYVLGGAGLLTFTTFF